MQIISKQYGLIIHEFSVAPQISPPNGGLPYHEWFVDMEDTEADLAEVSASLDKELRRQNIYYQDLITSNIIRPLTITRVIKGAFRLHMASIGKLGGQNKVPRLMNNRSMACLLYTSPSPRDS